MKIAMDMLCRIFSRALDVIETEQFGASDYHSMRVSALCAAMGKQMGYDDDTRSALATCALFHDNALTEYHLTERGNGQINIHNMVMHCEKGQNNVSWLPFKKNIDGIILYHHERGDGQGPFRKREGEYPFEAALLAAADSIDVAYRLQRVPKALPVLRDEIAKRANTYSTRAAIDVLLDVLDAAMLESLRDENISGSLSCSLPRWEVDVSEDSVIGIAGFAAHIIDYKSQFTRKHTSQIANRAWLMAHHYGYNRQEQAALYLAASLHDVGKIATPTEVLEKPGKLNDEEFQIIKKHVRDTHDWLCDVPDFDLIRNWAANHHEKLDGSGYSFGKSEEELDFNSRLMACLDIYQAVSEPRPYHDARTHAETMQILYSMADKGFIDAQIVKDLDEAMEEYSMCDIPSPAIIR